MSISLSFRASSFSSARSTRRSSGKWPRGRPRNKALWTPGACDRKRGAPDGLCVKGMVEAATGFEPVIRALQARALPLGYAAILDTFLALSGIVIHPRANARGNAHKRSRQRTTHSPSSLLFKPFRKRSSVSLQLHRPAVRLLANGPQKLGLCGMRKASPEPLRK